MRIFYKNNINQANPEFNHLYALVYLSLATTTIIQQHLLFKAYICVIV